MQVGVIGTGALGRHHARLYSACPQADLVGVFDVNRESACKVAAQTGTKVFESIEDLANACAGLSVVVPAHLHHRVAMPLLGAGKHLLVEKPVASTVAEARELVAAARQRGLVLAVGHVERFSPALAAATEFPGPVRYFSARRCSPFPPARPNLPPRGCEVSVVHDLMIHDLDLCLMLMQATPVAISALARSVLSTHEDFVAARLTFADGRVADITASRLAEEPARKLLLAKDAGHVNIDLRLRQATVQRFADGQSVGEAFPVRETNPLADELADFCTAASAVRAGRPARPRVDGQAGLRALELAEDILAVARQRK